MVKVGIFSILVGLVTIVGYVLFTMMSEASVPVIIKGAILFILIGAVVVIIKQIFTYQEEKKEKDEYKDL